MCQPHHTDNQRCAWTGLCGPYDYKAPSAIAIRELSEKSLQVLVPYNEVKGERERKRERAWNSAFIGVEGGGPGFGGSLCIGKFKTVSI